MASEGATDSTFIFVDLAGFTSLTEAHGDVEAKELVRQFESDVEPLLAEHGATEIKCIGDAAAFVQG